MYIVIGIMFAGVGAGLILKRFITLKWLNILILMTVCLLLFFMGLTVGSNELIIKNIGTTGLQAFIIGTAATAGSILAGWGVYRLFFKKEEKNL